MAFDDLSICDFFLSGYLKSSVYEDKLRTLDELKESIHQQITQANFFNNVQF